MTGKPLTLIQTGIVNGVWQAVLTGAPNPPELAAFHQGNKLEGLTVTPMPGQAGDHSVLLAIPATVLNEGVQTVLLRADDDILASFTLVVGVPLEEDLRAEISLLRAELDLLKKVFRRHVSKLQG